MYISGLYATMRATTWRWPGIYLAVLAWIVDKFRSRAVIGANSGNLWGNLVTHHGFEALTKWNLQHIYCIYWRFREKFPGLEPRLNDPHLITRSIHHWVIECPWCPLVYIVNRIVLQMQSRHSPGTSLPNLPILPKWHASLMHWTEIHTIPIQRLSWPKSLKLVLRTSFSPDLEYTWYLRDPQARDVW